MMNEMESLNLDDLDVENLERRLELAATVPDPNPCTTDGCIGNSTCRDLCGGNASWHC